MNESLRTIRFFNPIFEECFKFSSVVTEYQFSIRNNTRDVLSSGRGSCVRLSFRFRVNSVSTSLFCDS